MTKNLLIVESPAKAKTIEKFLGKDFKVKSSFGHIRDLKKGKGGVVVDENFQTNYEVSEDKSKVVKDLKTWVNKVENVWLATDEDREGEAISWHLCEVLGLNPKETKRIVFSEITKSAIQKAVSNPRTVDLNLVDAQQARRVLDRLVGFELSEILWRKVRGKLSAGRVQSVTVKLIVDKEREIQKFEVSDFYKIYAYFNVTGFNNDQVSLRAEFASKIESEEQALNILEQCKNQAFEILNIQKKPLTRRPSAPFTTSTLQQDASRKLGFSVKRTMSVAQKLYEQGFITYMRTDSTALSALAINTIKDEIIENYGEDFSKVRTFKPKSSNAQEAHEAIRPTYINNHNAGSDNDQRRLYELIWKRTIASQMADAKIEKTIVEITPANQKQLVFKAEGEVLKFEGFLKVYLESKDEDEQEEAKGILPPLKVGQNLDLDKMESIQRFTRPPARYTEASLVKKLEELGIGRPSTYAPTISKIMEKERGYVTKESREGNERAYKTAILKDNEIIHQVLTEITGTTKNRLYPSDIGMLVTDFLDSHFQGIMDYHFTADIEKKFDIIAKGELEWKKMIESFYKPFHTTVEDTIENAERAKGTRELGIDPESGRKVLVQMTRYGPAVQIGAREEMPEDEKPRFASLRVGQSMESITYEEAMELFKLPKTIGEYESKPVEVNIGRFGPYVKFDGAFVSLPKDLDPLDCTLAQAVRLIEDKRKADAPIALHDNLPVQKGIGRFGPYLKWSGMFINVPKKYDFENLSMADIVELIEKKKEKEANRFVQQWPEDSLAIENGRWGPFIRFKKKSIKLPKIDDKRMTSEEAAKMTLDEVKKLVEAEIPNAFEKKKTTKKKPAAKKKPAVKKKPAAKKK